MIQALLFRKPTAIPLLVALILAAVVCYLATAGEMIDLSSPDATILTYCQAVKRADFSAVRETFHENARLEEASFKKPLWTECKILDKHKTKLVGQDLGNGLRAQGEDVEVVTEAKMIDVPKGNPKTKFWYLLRKVGAAWKIISNSHIPDKNYPPLD